MGGEWAGGVAATMEECVQEENLRVSDAWDDTGTRGGDGTPRRENEEKAGKGRKEERSTKASVLSSIFLRFSR